MDNLTLVLLLDVALFVILIGLFSYHIRYCRRDRRKTEQIEQELDTERQKTNKFHVSIEEIRKLTKG